MQMVSALLNTKVSSHECSYKTPTLFAYKKQKLTCINQTPIPFVPQIITAFIMTRKKIYSGVALYCKKQPDKIISGIDWQDVDAEGRFIEAQFGNLSVISLYLPSGSSEDDRQAFKFTFLEKLTPYLQEYLLNGRDYIICGD
ncbi:MAG: hypothetical protein ACXWT1_04140 [Methylobacter sp.]